MIDEKTSKELIVLLDNQDKGFRVMFRRSCGKLLNEVDSSVLMAFYRITQGRAQAWEENRVFLALCIHALWDSDEKERSSIDCAIRRFEDAEGEIETESLKKRIIHLMDTEWDENGFCADKFTRVIKFLKQKGYPIAGDSVMQDLIHWNDFSKTVQKRWAYVLNKN